MFGGYNALKRGGQSIYVSYISVGKGRDMGLDSILGFEAKVGFRVQGLGFEAKVSAPTGPPAVRLHAVLCRPALSCGCLLCLARVG